MLQNEYMPFLSEILNVKKHTEIEYTFRMNYDGKVNPGQFFEVSIPKYGECPISVSGIGEGFIELTIRRVGKVTNEIFESYKGDHLFLRGPYGNGFELEQYEAKDLVIIAGGTGISPVRGVIEYFSTNSKKRKHMSLIAGFKSPHDILFRDDFERWKETMDLVLTVDEAEDTYDGKIGMVTKYIPQLNHKNFGEVNAIVVGPPAMMRFSVDALLKTGFQEKQIWVSYERKMCCGIGKCGHCKINDTYVCLDGPVYPYTKGKLLID